MTIRDIYQHTERAFRFVQMLIELSVAFMAVLVARIAWEIYKGTTDDAGKSES